MLANNKNVGKVLLLLYALLQSATGMTKTTTIRMTVMTNVT